MGKMNIRNESPTCLNIRASDPRNNPRSERKKKVDNNGEGAQQSYSLNVTCE
jgi:hypothetical protein